MYCIYDGKIIYPFEKRNLTAVVISTRLIGTSIHRKLQIYVKGVHAAMARKPNSYNPKYIRQIYEIVVLRACVLYIIITFVASGTYLQIFFSGKGKVSK